MADDTAIHDRAELIAQRIATDRDLRTKFIKDENEAIDAAVDQAVPDRAALEKVVLSEVPKKIRLEIEIAAPYDAVWRELSDLSSYAEWMTDAETVNFTSDQTGGVGTEMRVLTKVGPLRTNDLMTVVEWEEGRLITVRHRGRVAGEGRFEITGGGDSSVLVWTEDLRFPWWLGGPVGAALASPVLKLIWRKNLERFRDRVAPPNAP